MAIPYAGVHRKLKDADTPWETKVILARFAWVSPRCYLPNKEQVLMDWAANSLANANKLSVPEHAIPSLWQFLHDTLRSRRLQDMGCRVEALSLRASLFPVILKSLQVKNDHVDLVVGCCHSLLDYQSLGSIITGTLDHQVQFLSSVINLLNAFLKSDPSNNVPHKLNSVVQKTFGCFAALQRQQQNPRKVCTVVYEKLLRPCLMLHHTITTLARSAQEDDIISDTLKCISDLITNGLFNRDLIDGHAKYLKSVYGQVTADKQKESRLLQETISTLWKNLAEKVKGPEAECSFAYIAGMPVIFRAFMSAQKMPNDVSFLMFCKLSSTMGVMPAMHDGNALSGVENQPMIKSDDLDPVLENKANLSVATEVQGLQGNWEIGLPAVNELLSILSVKRIYEVAVDRMSGQTQFKQLSKLAEDLISSADSSSPAWFGCLGSLLDMNHLILEDKLTWILKEALYGPNQASLARDTQRERDTFLERLLGTYTKLRQFDRIVAALLQACKVPSADAEHFSYSTEFSKSFSANVQLLPLGLSLDIWKQFLDEFSCTYRPDIIQSSPSPSPKKKLKQSQGRSEVNMAAFVATFDLFLRNVRLVEGSLTVPLLRRGEELMAEMRDGMLKPLLQFCTDFKPSVKDVYCTLVLCHVWGELHLLLTRHTDYSGKDAFPNLKESAMDFGDLSFVHSYWMSKDWLQIWKKFAKRENVMQMRVLLAVQQARALLMHTSCPTGAIQQSLVNIATVVCEQATNENSPHSNKSALPILLENVPFLLPFICSENLNCVVALVCETLVQRNGEESCGQTQNERELLRSCEVFVASEFCTESRELQTALVTSLLSEMSKVVLRRPCEDQTSAPAVLCSLLQRLSETGAGLKDLNKDTMERTQCIASEMNTLLSRTDLDTTVGQVGPDVLISISEMLKVMKLLPLHHLLPSNKTRCMLGLLLIDYAVTSLSGKKSPSGTHLATVLLCRQLEVAILKSVTNKEEFLGILNAGKILSVMTESFIGLGQKVAKRSPVGVMQSLNDVTEELLSYWLKRLRQQTNQEESFKEYSHKMYSRLDEFTTQLAKFPNPIQLMSSNLPLLTISTALLRSLFASRGALGTKLSSDLGQPIMKLLCRIMRHVQDCSMSTALLRWHVKVGTIFIKSALRSASKHSELQIGQESDSSDDSNMETSDTIAMIPKNEWDTVLKPVLQEICTFFGSTGEKSRVLIGSCLSYMQMSCVFIGQCCDAGTIGVATSEMWLALLSLMGTGESSDENMLDELRATLSKVVETMDLVQFHTLLADLLEDIKPGQKPELDGCVHLHGVLLAWQLLPACVTTEATQRALADVIRQAMDKMLLVLKEAVKDWMSGGAIALSVLRAVSSVIGQGKSLLSPHKAMQTQHFCLVVPVATVTTAEFPLVFSTVCQILRSHLIGYSDDVMRSQANFMACLQHLLRAAMHRGQQTNGTTDTLSDQDLYMCAENMERLLTMLATFKNDVQKLGVFLIADYIAELQKGTLQPLFKKALVPGVYNLLDACDERAVDYLNAKLPNHLREIFKTFYSDFQKFYRYSGKV